MNAYLPMLARDAPEVVATRAELEALRDEALDHLDSDSFRAGQPEPHQAESEGSTLLSHNGNSASGPSSSLIALMNKYESLLSQATARISSLGIALGYGAGIILLLLTLIPVRRLHGSTWSLRLAIGLSGIWWGTGCIPVMLWLPGGRSTTQIEEQGALLSSNWFNRNQRVEDQSLWESVKDAWKRLGEMLKWSEIKKLRNTFRYLAAWFLLSDGKYHPLNDILLANSTRFHDHHIYRPPFRKDFASHGSLISYFNRHPHTPLWNPWIFDVASTSAAV